MGTTRASILDLSQVQGDHVDFAKVRAGGYDGVILKATEGAHYEDPDYRANSVRAKAAGLAVGAYMFLTSGSPVPDQVALFIGAVDGRADFACVDMEGPAPEQWSPPITAEAIVGRALEAAQLLAQVFTTRKVFVYSYVYFLQCLAKAHPPSLALLLAFGLWIASYHDEKHAPRDSDQPTVPPPFTAWSFWQWSGDKGNAAPGVPCVVDHNVYNGTREEFFAALVDPDGWEAATDPGSPPP